MFIYECKRCGETDPAKFGFRIVGGRSYPRHLCKSCWTRYTLEVRSTESQKKRNDREQKKHKERRKLGINTARYVFQDSKNSDRKRGLENDLNKSFVAAMLDKPCAYCGDTSIRMTLDRIDNTRGHVQSNVVPSCIRCNYARRTMPYEAWLVVSKGMREAREAGLFGEWTGRAR